MSYLNKEEMKENIIDCCYNMKKDEKNSFYDNWLS